ncbi:hypothetical protein HY085_01305 [Candidatus Gottesmanbacteria bacterium]|nr:hypothetical protein [Candidatus Gottesmanbacteria bacterium]
MNGSSTVLSGQTFAAEDFYSEILSLEKALARLKEKFLKMMPAKYGSDAWWERMDKQAEEGILAGKGKKFDTYEEAVNYLHS